MNRDRGATCSSRQTAVHSPVLSSEAVQGRQGGPQLLGRRSYEQLLAAWNAQGSRADYQGMTLVECWYDY